MTESSPPASSADRALRALAGIAGDSRPRVPGDAADPDIPVAATVVLARDGAEGLEVLVIERPDRGSFAGAWVFPGGKVDDADRDGAEEQEESVARRAAVRETWEETALVVDGADLVALSVWDPPPGLPLRIRTWFFVAAAPAAEPQLSPDEAVAAEWVRPDAILARHARGDVTLYPPTWVTLHALAAAVTVEGLVAATRAAGIQRFETVARRSDGGSVLLWAGDDEYEDGAGGSARHRLEIGAVPWIYTRSD